MNKYDILDSNTHEYLATIEADNPHEAIFRFSLVQPLMRNCAGPGAFWRVAPHDASAHKHGILLNEDFFHTLDALDMIEPADEEDWLAEVLDRVEVLEDQSIAALRVIESMEQRVQHLEQLLASFGAPSATKPAALH